MRNNIKKYRQIFSGLCLLGALCLGPSFIHGIVSLELKLVSPLKQVARKSLKEIDNLKEADKERLANGLIRHLRSRSIETRISAAEALGHIGPPAKNAVFPLLNSLNFETDTENYFFNTSLRRSVIFAIEKIGSSSLYALLEAIKHDSPWVRNAAAIGLSNVNPELAASKAVPEILPDLRHEYILVRRGAVLALGEMGPTAWECVPSLIRALKRSKKEFHERAIVADKRMLGFLRTEIVETLGEIGPGAKKAVPVLMEELRTPSSSGRVDDNVEFHLVAARALERISPVSIPKLVKELESRYLELCRRSAVVLGRIGPEAEAAIVPIKDIMLSDRFAVEFRKDNSIFDDFLQSLDGIAHSETKFVMAKLAELEAERAEKETVQSVLDDAFLRERREGEIPLDRYIRILQHSNPVVRRKAVLAISKLGPRGEKVVSALSQSLVDVDDLVQQEAAVVLGNMGPIAAPAAPYLIHALFDSHADVRKEAAIALGKIGPSAKEAVPYLIEATTDQNSDVRRMVSDALVLIGLD